MNLDDLGLTVEEVQERVIDRLCEKLLKGTSVEPAGQEPVRSEGFDGADTVESDIGRRETLEARLDARIEALINQAVHNFAEANVRPVIEERIEKLVLQRTTEWGEKQGEPLTFKEYLLQRAEHYMTEQVDYEGRTAKQRRSGGYGSNGAEGARIAFLVDKHLHFHIERAMQKALENANSHIVKGLQETVELKLKEIAAQMKVSVKREE